MTFNTDGTGFSSEDSFYFSTSNNDKDYNKFNWDVEVDEKTIVYIRYDYSPDEPVLPYINSEGYTVVLNNCDLVQFESTFSGNPELTR